MEELVFSVPGLPVPKQRARTFLSKGGKVLSRTPPETRSYERLVGMHAGVAAARARWEPRPGPHVLHVAVVWPDRRRRDLDNLVKSIADALNGVAWDDDSSVVELHAVSSVNAHNPGVIVRVER